MTSPCTEAEMVVAAFYHFVHLPDYAELKPPLLGCCQDNGILGTLLLADEGVNGTIAGSRAGIDAVMAHLRSDPRFAGLKTKESRTDSPPFQRMKVKLKSEIVTMGVANVAPTQMTGVRVDGPTWNELLKDPDVMVLDTRNEYECAIGSFTNAVSPGTETFREFPGFVQREMNPEQQRKVAMFCTGGIRCEKASNYLLQHGFEEVYHLDGGILQYLQDMPPQESLWHGECFVFDDRVAVSAQLLPGSYTQCSACRRPVSASQRACAQFVEGISCPHCIDKISDDKKARLSERRRQTLLAAERSPSKPESDT
jgi:UPF0176 protein